MDNTCRRCGTDDITDDKVLCENCYKENDTREPLISEEDELFLAEDVYDPDMEELSR